MKKRGVFGFVFGVCLLFSACGRTEKQDLKQIARPYFGTYECKSFRFCGEDRFSTLCFARIELEKDVFRFIAKEQGGETVRSTGRYEYDEKSGEIFFYSEFGEGEKNARGRLSKGRLSLFLRCEQSSCFLLFSK